MFYRFLRVRLVLMTARWAKHAFIYKARSIGDPPALPAADPRQMLGT